MTQIILKGKVAGGMGAATQFFMIEGYAGRLAEKLGFQPYPGTLNIIVDKTNLAQLEPMRREGGILIEGFEEKGHHYGPARIRKATLMGEPAALIFPARTRHPDEVVEIIAGENLREKFGLKDGDEVEVEI